jgi:hypothetical protein
VPATTVPTSEGGGSSWWLWLLVPLAVAAVVGGILLARSRQRRSWLARAGAAFDEADQITTHLVGLEPGGAATVADADATRLAALAATVQQLESSASSATARQAIASLQEPLRALHASLDAVALAPEPPSASVLDQVRRAASELHHATSLARANVLPAPPSTSS